MRQCNDPLQPFYYIAWSKVTWKMFKREDQLKFKGYRGCFQLLSRIQEGLAVETGMLGSKNSSR